MAIREVLTAPRSPWQGPYVERLIGSIRRKCLAHVMVFNEASLRRTLKGYFQYYGYSRTHLSLAKDASDERAVQPPETGSGDGTGGGRRTTPSLRRTRRLKRRFFLLAVLSLPLRVRPPPRIGPQHTPREHR